MKLVAPLYYEKFKCIAGDCTHSCCVCWEIDADRETLEWHRCSEHSLSHELLSSLADVDGVKYIELSEDGRCPFLNAEGLCRMIIGLGEERTPLICREHPRFYHRIGERYELGIGAVCEEAARLILSEDPCGSYEVERDILCDIDSTDYDTLSEREKILSVVRDSQTLDEALDKLLLEYSIPRSAIYSDEVLSSIKELELLTEEHRNMLSEIAQRCDKCKERFAKRLLSYFVYRHVSIARNAEDLRASLAFSILLTMIFCACDVCDIERAVSAARIISEEIEYSEENTDTLKLALFSLI